MTADQNAKLDILYRILDQYEELAGYANTAHIIEAQKEGLKKTEASLREKQEGIDYQVAVSREFLDQIKTALYRLDQLFDPVNTSMEL